jgi:hypothetical protein
MAPEAYSAFTDESGVGERYLTFGGVFLPTENVGAVESRLEHFCQERGFEAREMSWKKCSASKMERYVAFVELLWILNEQLPRLDFRALVVDTKLNPLRNPQFKCPTREDGFYKFYHFFITRSFQHVAKGARRFDVTVASTEDQYPYRTQVLSITVAGALRKHFGADTVIHEVDRADPKQARVHQLADVLLGAVSFKYNRFDPASHKAIISRAIEERTGRNLRADYRPADRPFNVWSFGSKGTHRWAPGARGRI